VIDREKTVKNDPKRRFLDAKASQWANFYRFCKNFASWFYFLSKNAVSVSLFQVMKYLGRNKTRNAICQKQLHLSHFYWSLACQHVQTLQVLLLVQHQSQSRSQHQLRLLSTKKLGQEPVGVLGNLPRMYAFGSVS